MSTINNGEISKRLEARVGKINNARRVPFNRIDVGGHTLSGYSRWIPSSIVSQGVLIVIPLDAGHKRLNQPGGGHISICKWEMCSRISLRLCSCYGSPLTTVNRFPRDIGRPREPCLPSCFRNQLFLTRLIFHRAGDSRGGGDRSNE